MKTEIEIQTPRLPPDLLLPRLLSGQINHWAINL
jgi:hypothetical protein